MAETDTPEIQIDKLGISLVASRREYKDTKALLTAAQATIAAHKHSAQIPMVRLSRNSLTVLLRLASLLPLMNCSRKLPLLKLN